VVQHQEHKARQEAKERERQIEEQNRIKLENDRARQEEITRDISYVGHYCLVHLKWRRELAEVCLSSGQLDGSSKMDIV
jgi:hypothetical protein